MSKQKSLEMTENSYILSPTAGRHNEYPENKNDTLSLKSTSTSGLPVTFVPGGTEDNNSVSKIAGKWRQIYSALAATMSAVGIGTVLAYTATALPDLRQRKPFGEITPFEETWIGPLALLGAVSGCPVAGFMVDGIGRRKTLVWLMPLFFFGWIFIAVSANMEMICVGRFITGFCCGSSSLVIPVFLSEISDVKIRGALTSCLDMMVTVGILYIYLIGTYASWRIQAFACGLIPIFCFILMIFVPESPQFLLAKGNKHSAEKALSWFRNSEEDAVKEEFSELLKSVEERNGKTCSWRDILKVPVLKPISIGLTLMFLQQCCGILPITAYTVDIFHSAGTDINDNLSTNIVGVIQVVATITSALVVDRCGRRFLLLLSESFMVVSMSGMCIFFYLKNHNDPTDPFPMDHLSWLPLTSLLIFVVAFSIGIGPISWMYVGEILPSHVKGKGSGIVTLTSWILSFVITLGFRDLMSKIGEEGVYGLFGGVCIFGIFYVYFFVLETKGKSLDEIQLYFTKKTSNRNQV